jgi:D-proline reductase (dithiol) PrdB
MPMQYMETIRARYARLGYAPYRWFEASTPSAWKALSRPLARLRLGLLSTSGAYVRGQRAYHYRDDCSLRAIPVDTPDTALRFSHITENYLVDARKDPGCILPLATLRKLVTRGVIGSLASDVFSCMGGIYSQRRVREETAPAVLDAFKAEGVEAALLVAM